MQSLITYTTGLETMPQFWGSSIRHREPTGALDGFAEGIKSFAYGFGDGIGGLVYKPVLGGRQNVSPCPASRPVSAK